MFSRTSRFIRIFFIPYELFLTISYSLFTVIRCKKPGHHVESVRAWHARATLFLQLAWTKTLSDCTIQSLRAFVQTLKKQVLAL